MQFMRYNRMILHSFDMRFSLYSKHGESVRNSCVFCTVFRKKRDITLFYTENPHNLQM